MDIYLKKAIMHIVDRNQEQPMYSATPLDISISYISDYLIKKIKGLVSAQTKLGTLKNGSFFSETSKGLPDDFVATSEKLTDFWWQAYKNSEDGPSCDIFVCQFERDGAVQLAFFKVNFHDAYTHYVEADESGVNNQLILHRAILASMSQKADEGLLLNLETLDFHLVEKKYTFSGEKKLYFSTAVIDAEPAPSLDANVSVIKKVAEKVGSDFNTPKYDIIADVKEAVYETISETGQMSVDDIADKVFENNITAKQAFKAGVLEKGFVDQAPIVENIKLEPEKKFGKQKLKLSNGIELIVPIDVYKNPDLIEFINNPDGTISVTIKNVEEVVNRL